MKGLFHYICIVSLAFAMHMAYAHDTGIDPSGNPLGYTVSDYPADSILGWILEGDKERVKDYLADHDVNERLGSSGMTLLVYSIQHGRPSLTSLLIKNGADVTMDVHGISPLMYASGGDSQRKVNMLLEAGADLKRMDADGNTALFYAASNGNMDLAKILVKRGANLRHKNKAWMTAYDMSVRHSQQEVAGYLRSEYEKRIPDLLDGPYLKWSGKKKLRAFYMKHDEARRITRRVKESFKVETTPFELKGFAGDPRSYRIDRWRNVPPEELENAERIMVIGDIHGGYDSLVYFLRKNEVINSSLEWTWEDGHLVFVGDIFDRGDKVTESLWLIYNLESMASEAGGAVHLILGNHEIMVLSGDVTYVSDKYILLSERLNINYSYLFGKKTVLGQWLRSRNTILKLNGHLFVHAGLSPEIIKTGLNINEINESVRYFINYPERDTYKEAYRYTLMGENGPFWYRGFLEHNHEYLHLSEDGFESVLSYFDANYIFIGHTNVDEVTALYNNRVFAIDVPFYNYGHSMFGLLLKGEEVYLLNTSAEQKRIR